MKRVSRLFIGLFVCALLAAPAAMADSLLIQLDAGDVCGADSDPLAANLTIEEVAGDLKFTIQIVPESGTGNIGDLRGFFFNVTNESLLGGLSVTGADVTDSQFLANAVVDLGNGANLNGCGELFDAGVEIGTQGIGADDIQLTVFTVSHTTDALSLSFIDDSFFGLRATSVGPAGSDREGSSKLVGGSVIPTPAAAGAGLLLLGAMGLRRRQA